VLLFYRPEMSEDTVTIDIEDGRHPVIDALKGEGEQYVPNSTRLSVSRTRTSIVYIARYKIYTLR
jgi:DNA mismatch repair ATPase MutS